MAFTFVFFIVPLITLLKISLSTKPDPVIPNYDFTWEWGNFSHRLHRLRQPAAALVRLRRHRHVLVRAHRLPDRLLHRLQGRAVAATSCSGS
jgi:hypothetical protein